MIGKQQLLLFAIFGFAFLLIWKVLSRVGTPSGTDFQQTTLPSGISYNFHVKPILSDKCFACHGPDKNERKAGLRLDVEAAAKGELSENHGKYAIIEGDVAGSELINRILSTDKSTVMPPPEVHLELSADEKAILSKWIEQGAPYEQHWSFIKPEKKPLPEVANEQWPVNEIDYFVLNRMNAAGLDPAPSAAAHTLLRRLCLDITGLPPTIDELDRFVVRGELNHEEAIDYYLAKPAYGERMARDWLDLARYADSHGFQDDSYRTMWPWRDWVIDAFNRNMPYDQFITWQLAGDLLPHATKEQVLATAFNRNHPITQEGGVIDEEYRSIYVGDRTNTLGKGLLGLTLECAKCHDHKYDPILQKDYFSMYAFFNYVNEKGIQMDAVQAKNRKYYADAPYISIEDEDLQDILSFINKQDEAPLNVMVMNDSTKRDTYILARGNYDQPTQQVSASAPEVIMSFSDTLPQNRLGLAMWLSASNNPLTARVYVNRLWAALFGQGLVSTVEDFGNQGALPTHPQLLDWMAVDFMEHGWDTKYLIKKILLSATYRQSSVITDRKRLLDPENIYLSRGARYRLGAEEIRDYYLVTVGLLNTQIGGPSVKPYQPKGLWEETNAGGNRGILTKYFEDSGDALYRRSLYTFWKRTLPPPSMTIFDAPNRDLCEVRRQKTNTPLQALALQNDVQVLECARYLSQQVLLEAQNDEEAINLVFRRILLRNPEKRHFSTMKDYYHDCIERFESQPDDATKLLAVGKSEVQVENPVRAASLMMVAQVLYNLDETINKE
jgi:cytochrome c553